MRRALVTWGGWDGHQPKEVAEYFSKILQADGVEVTLTDSLACFDDAPALLDYDLIVPVWTMSELSREAAHNVSEAVARGTGLAGCHGGMCDAFRANVLWQFMTGGNWVAHPGGDGVKYRVRISQPDHELVSGIGDFDVKSEQYYLHVDPAVDVLAVTKTDAFTWFHSTNPAVDMPVIWTKSWGLGRVYYNALGHQLNIIDNGPAAELMRRGLIWASHGRKAAADAGQTIDPFVAAGSHY